MSEIKVDDKTSVLTRPKGKRGLKWLLAQMVNTDVDSIGDYLLMDVLIPSLRNMAWSFSRSVVDQFFKVDGKTAGSILGSPDYHGAYGNTNSSSSSVARNKNFFMEGEWFIFRSDYIVSRDAGDAILKTLEDAIVRYGHVNIPNLCSECNEPAPEYTYNKYGWRSVTELKKSTVQLGTDGKYFLRMPKPIAI